MNLALLDWLIIAALFAGMVWIAASLRRYTRSVNDFLAGNRCDGLYLLTTSEGLTALSLVGTIANFEKFYHAGSSPAGFHFCRTGLISQMRPKEEK